MGSDQQFVVPAGILRAFESGDDATRAWARVLSSVAGDLLYEWQLRPEGVVRSGAAGIVVPVRRADGTRAALKLQVPRAETTAAILGLVQWNGRGIVRLLDSDPGRGAMLLERLHGDRSLEALEDDDSAVRVVGSLLARLHSTPAPEGLPHVGTVLAGMLSDAPAAMGSLEGEDRSRLHRWMRIVAELEAEPGNRLLHWDLHYGNVLAADREPWLAIDPEPLVGDPGFDLWPALDSGWSTDDAVSDAHRIVRRRFDILTEMLNLDRARAAGWTVARLLQNTLWDIEDGQAAISPSAKTVDDALASFDAFGAG
ncbi:aminoglycoside phosphotransferase family protein [Microbacterium paraoxydans]|uniref:Hydroxyurea phosphotransferase n=1 Tax=Microbacterium paraoxydans TaxID=199592 RepID=A0ABS5IM29_9MICO|nr:aminoglycoside phosphotransferase family protein [Microbacterium paraoxydans]MBS0024008.1 hydroxyurea phosphotransferase [Microbacterium paraoxydans]